MLQFSLIRCPSTVESIHPSIVLLSPPALRRLHAAATASLTECTSLSTRDQVSANRRHTRDECHWAMCSSPWQPRAPGWVTRGTARSSRSTTECRMWPAAVANKYAAAARLHANIGTQNYCGYCRSSKKRNVSSGTAALQACRYVGNVGVYACTIS